MCAFGVLGLSCASPCGPVWWGRRDFTRQPESPNVRVQFRFFGTKTETEQKLNEERERER